jgi:hypothetical protein
MPIVPFAGGCSREALHGTTIKILFCIHELIEADRDSSFAYCQ